MKERISPRRSSALCPAPLRSEWALSALVFLYGKVLGLDLPWLASIGRPQAPRGFRSCFPRRGRRRAVVVRLHEHRLFAKLLYGTGMRLMEGLDCA